MNDTTPEQLSTIRRIINFVRFWINIRGNVTVILHNQAQVAQVLANSTAHLRRINARLDYYEHTVPLLGKAGAQFRQHEKKLMQSAEAQADYEAREQRRAAAQTAGSFPSEPVPTKPQLELVSR